MNETPANLLKAFAGESMARNKYTFYAKRARKEGLEWVARVFEETADNERAHAEEEFEQITGRAEMTNTYDIHELGSTLENLKNAVAGETYEYTTMYPQFAEAAENEGDTFTATLLRNIAEVEKRHAARYQKLVDWLENGDLYQSKTEQEWLCTNCGYVHKSKNAPTKCPLCKKPRGWYKRSDIR